MRRLRLAAVIGAAVSLVLSACGKSTPSSTGGSAGGATTTVGFIMVGSRSDYGYNQAVYDASQTVKKDLGSAVNVLVADNIPETNQVVTTMQSMVSAGAKVIFATSYGYYQYAHDFAKANPNVYVFHQGGYDTDATMLPNFGTYWGQAFEPVSLGGMAAGATTKSNKLGFVYAFPIPQTVANIDAFEVGAKLVNPSAQTITVATSAWCDTTKQKQSADSLIAQGADVLSQHQDCQSTVLNDACQASAKVVGYHYDAASLCPKGWLTGSAWDWAPVYKAIIASVTGGSFKGGKYNGNWVGSFATGDNPLTLASFGSSVDSDLQGKITAEEAKLKMPATSVFTSDMLCNDGTTPLFHDASGKALLTPGQVPTYAQINALNCFVQGVVGTVPKS